MVEEGKKEAEQLVEDGKKRAASTTREEEITIKNLATIDKSTSRKTIPVTDKEPENENEPQEN